MARRHVAARIADQELQDRARVLLVGQQSQAGSGRRRSGCWKPCGPFLSKAYVSPVSPNRPSCRMRVNSFSGRIRSAEHADDLKAVVANRRSHEHRRHAGPQSGPLSSFIATTLANGAETIVVPSKRAREERVVLGNILLADQLRSAGGDDPLLLVGHDVAGVVVGRERRAQRFFELRAQRCDRLGRRVRGVRRRRLRATDKQFGGCRRCWPAIRRSTSAR